MADKPFNAVHRTSLHREPAQMLHRWIEAYIQALFPDNGIEYWSWNEHCEGPLFIKAEEHLADIGSVHHVGCYVHRGSSEGNMIEIQIMVRQVGMRRLCYAKSFGSQDECWAIARACSDALLSIFGYEEAPMIVEIAAKLPRKRYSRWDVVTSGPVELSQHGDTVTVVSERQVIDLQEFANDGGNHQATAYANDWELMLKRRGIDVQRSQTRFLTAPDLPGYVISDRGVEDITGFYVLPPGGNPHNDRDYLGYYPDATAALTAARTDAESRRQPVAA